MKKLSEIFDYWYGVNLELCNCEIVKNGIPFVSRTSQNNGVAARVARIENITPNPAHSLSIAGGGSVLSCFYQDEEYYSGRDLFVLKPKVPMDKKMMLLYSYVIQANKYKYNYGRQANKTFKDIILPEPEELKSLIAVKFDINHRFKNNSLSSVEPSLFDREWKLFGFDKIFVIKKGSRLTKADMVDGNIPYIGAIESNNGVSSYIDNREHLHKGNVITVSYNGSIGNAFYQEKEFWATDDVNVLYPKYKFNRYIAMFLLVIIEKEKYRYNYGRKWDKQSMENSRMRLPVNAMGKPDWQFMEDYIKSLPYSVNI